MQVWNKKWYSFICGWTIAVGSLVKQNLFVSKKNKNKNPRLTVSQSLKRGPVKSSFICTHFHNTFCFKPPLLKIGPYKFPIEKTKGNCGKEKKKNSERNVLLHVLWHRQAFTFSSTRRIVNVWSHLPVKSIFVCRDVSCDKLSDVRALAARKFAITLLTSVPQCTLGNISWALSDWNSV